MWSSTDTEILKMLVAHYEPHTTKVGWGQMYTMKEFKIKIKTQKQFLVQMNLIPYYSLKLQLFTEYTHTQPICKCFLLPYISTFLYFMFILFPFTRLIILLCLFLNSPIATSFLIHYFLHGHEIFRNSLISPSLNTHFKGQPLCIILLQTVFYSYHFLYKFFTSQENL